MIEVLRAGLFTTVQDNGRFGFRHRGVPLSGVMDRKAAHRANSLIGNGNNAAVLECTFNGPTLKFATQTTVCFVGGKFRLGLNGKEIEMEHLVSVNADDVLEIGNALQGMRGYLSVDGGIQTPKVLGSRSFYRGITMQQKLEKGDRLPILPHQPKMSKSGRMPENYVLGTKSLVVYKGPDFESVTPEVQEILATASFTVSAQSNRMAYLLDHPHQMGASEIRTGPVQPGTVQLTPSGVLVVLMRDAQTTGGYSRVLQLPEESIGHLSQCRPGETVHLQLLHVPNHH